MTMDKLPRWSWWATGTLLVWTVCALLVGRPLMHKVAELRAQYGKSEAERIALDARIAAIPMLVTRFSDTKKRLDSTLSRFVTEDAVDDLVRQLRAAADRRGLGDVRADPELMSLLHVPMATTTPGTASGHLDTVIISLSASGLFKNLGRWMDVIEARPDFRFWTKCNWASSSDDGRVRLEAQAALVVVNQPDTLTTLVTTGQPK